MNLFLRNMIPSCSCFSAPSASKVASIDPEFEQDAAIQRFDSSGIQTLISNPKTLRRHQAGTGSQTPSASRNLDQPSARSPFNKSSSRCQRLYEMFHQELRVLRSIKPHPNIVRLIGYGDDRGGQLGTLVLEHVPNGTLHDALHGNVKSVLSWPQRVSIAYRLATALNYLHEECDLPVVHGDIKSSNVLLDDGMSPKLCDFGFARLGFSATVTRSAIPMMGSPGYVDPCYLRTGLVSKKSDVYSFGVLTLELISGMEAFSEEKSRMLTVVMRPRLKEMAVEEIVDARLGGEYNRDEVVIMARIAGRCIGENPSLRPAMGELLTLMRKDIPSAAFGRVSGKKIV
ncbi:uncharacterized protein A4U43_C04F22290 [Asparagus officinalis]|uniref:Protein kinase domain-containing protein n=1 Tax=Asparagus officinalis TaxID=4686 RepID=A0A5P1F5L3_ASPOF|nr:probable receptor-like protein kinase At4g10390 [Asparagus officinalis]ONK72707.1 uncharacterized protein A4U43_C04F22290 [Asparagus officinalis]